MPPTPPAAPPVDPRELFMLLGAKDHELFRLRQGAEREITNLRAANERLQNEILRLKGPPDVEPTPTHALFTPPAASG